MEKILGDVGQSFTRYFLPGLIFVVSVGSVSLLIWNDDNDPAGLITGESGTTIQSVVVLSLVVGYLLDSAGAYRWTLHYRSYRKSRGGLSLELARWSVQSADKDPDQFISKLWLQDERLYERIFSERAEWVLILESAFSLTVSSLMSAIYCLWLFFQAEPSFVWAALSFSQLSLSFLVSQKGIQRMRAHNSKLLAAVSSLYEETQPTSTDQNPQA